MAEKLNPLILDALGRAAAVPDGAPLYGTRSEPGLFPSTAAARTAAARALSDGLLQVVRTESRGRQSREFATTTESGLNCLLEQASPKKVLEDFVRALERREGEIAELLGTANRMAGTLESLKSTVAAVLPRVQSARLPVPSSQPPDRHTDRSLLTHGPARTSTDDGPHRHGVSSMNGVATLEATQVVESSDDLAATVLARLADWSASAAAGQDCPLPELFRSLSTREVPPSIGVFHDCLRELVADRRIYLHPWTGPLYALPEPSYALLVGHNVAYYASARGSN